MQKHEDPVVHWLLAEEQPAVRYFTLVDLLGRGRDDPEAKEALAEVAKRGWAAEMLRLQKPDGRWASRPAGSLYGPKYTATNWVALVLSDLGMTKDDARVRRTAEQFFSKWLDDSTEANIFKDEVCIVGNAARMLTRFGYGDDPRVKRLFERLVEDQKEDGGWHCFESKTGTLDCWEGLAAYAALPRPMWTAKIKASAERGAEFYLERKLSEEDGKKYLPWFRFHYPIHYYYDLLVGLDVTTRLGHGGDRRLRPALELLKKKRRADGTWLLDKLHPDLGAGAQYVMRKKPKPLALEAEGKPSKWITLTALRVLKRVEESV